MNKYITFAEVVRPVKITGLPKFVTVECEAADINFGHERNMTALLKQFHDSKMKYYEKIYDWVLKNYPTPE